MKKLFMFILVSSIICIPANASYCASYWARGYGGDDQDVAYCIQKSSDGGYIVAGHTTSFGAGHYDIWVLKLDNRGNVNWQKTYGGDNRDTARSIQQTTDGGYIVAGSADSFGVGGTDFWVLKLLNSGDISWQKTYGGSDNDDFAKSIQQTSDGGYIVAGITHQYSPSAIWVLKLDENGTVSWEKAYQWGGFSNNVYSIHQTLDGGYIVSGCATYNPVGEKDIWVLKLSDSGNISWQKTYGLLNINGESSIQQTSDGGYIVAGNTKYYSSTSSSDSDIWVFKLDSNGNVSWQKTYGGSDNDDFAKSIQQTSDGGYIVAGHTYSFGNGMADIWVFKLDSNGNVSWQKTYGGSDNDSASSVQQTTDGGYIVAGIIHEHSPSAIWVFKLDSNGEIPDCEIIGNSNAVVTDTSVIGQTTSATIQSTTAIINNTNITPQNTLSEITTICSWIDSDDDGIIDYDDNCPYDTNPLQEDEDIDGRGDVCDNCPNHPNGEGLGTCVKIVVGVLMGTGVTCESYAECEDNEYCQKEQGDCNGNDIGDVCECYADYNDDTFIDGDDLNKLKLDYGRYDCDTVPCDADGNDDGFVDGDDLNLLKNEYGRYYCPIP